MAKLEYNRNTNTPSDELDIVIMLGEYGYGYQLARPLVHQTVLKLEINAITEETKEQIIEDILAFHPILGSKDPGSRQ